MWRNNIHWIRSIFAFVTICRVTRIGSHSVVPKFPFFCPGVIEDILEVFRIAWKSMIFQSNFYKKNPGNLRWDEPRSGTSSCRTRSSIITDSIVGFTTAMLQPFQGSGRLVFQRFENVYLAFIAQLKHCQKCIYLSFLVLEKSTHFCGGKNQRVAVQQQLNQGMHVSNVDVQVRNLVLGQVKQT